MYACPLKFNLLIPVVGKIHEGILEFMETQLLIYKQCGTWSSLVQVIICHLCSAKPLPKPELTGCQSDP